MTECNTHDAPGHVDWRENVPSGVGVGGWRGTELIVVKPFDNRRRHVVLPRWLNILVETLKDQYPKT